jgi:sortase A
VAPSDVSVLRSGQLSQLTLVTCYPFDYVGSAPQRFIVQAELMPVPRGTAAAH